MESDKEKQALMFLNMYNQWRSFKDGTNFEYLHELPKDCDVDIILDHMRPVPPSGWFGNYKY